MGVVENMSGFTTPSGERFQIFGEGGGQELADELDVPLLAKVPLTMPLRAQADDGSPLVFTDPDDPPPEHPPGGARHHRDDARRAAHAGAVAPEPAITVIKPKGMSLPMA
jgi:ATP-binding protein involved in chromosome partitioning